MEGAELAALQGGIQSIRQHLPVIVSENAHGGVMDYLLNQDYIIIDRVGADTFFKHKSL